MNSEDGPNERPSPTHSKSASDMSTTTTPPGKMTTPTRPAGPKHANSITSWSNTSPHRSVGRGESTRFIQLSKQCVFMDMEDIVPPEKQDALANLVEDFLLSNSAGDLDGDNVSLTSTASESVNPRDSMRIQLSRKFVFMDMDNIIENRKQEDLAKLIDGFLQEEIPPSRESTPPRQLDRDSSVIRFSRKFVFRDMNQLQPHIKQDALTDLVESFIAHLPESPSISRKSSTLSSVPEVEETRAPSTPTGSSSRPNSTRIIQVSRKFVFMDMTDLVPESHQDELEEAVRTFLYEEENGNESSETALLAGEKEEKVRTRSMMRDTMKCLLL